MPAAAASWAVTNASLNGTRFTFTDRFEGRNVTTPQLLSRGLGYFIAPKAGNYSFGMIGDDIFQLQGLWHNVSGAAVFCNGCLVQAMHGVMFSVVNTLTAHFYELTLLRVAKRGKLGLRYPGTCSLVTRCSKLYPGLRSFSQALC